MSRADRRRGVDPATEAQARARVSAYSPGTPKPGLRFHHYRAGLRRSEAWPFLRTLLLLVVAVVGITILVAVVQTGR